MENNKSAPSSSPLGKDETSVAVAKTLSHTQIKISKVSHTWTISNFSFCSNKMGERLESVTFSDGINDKIKWFLSANPKGDNKENEDHFSLYLNLVSDEKSEIMAKVAFFILNAKGDKKYCSNFENTIRSGSGRGYAKYIKRDVLFDHANGLLPDDALTIVCKIDFVVDTVKVPGKNFTPKFKDTETSFRENLGLMLDTQQYSDVTLVVGDRELRAHKAILAAHSPVFSAMFKHEMEEQQQNRVDIIDIEDKVLEEMLRFIYTGKSTNIDTMATSLLVAADKYAIDSLKIMCEASLCQSLTKETASDMLVLADLHNADQLRAQVVNFIDMHTTDVLDSASFKSTLALHPRPLAETLRVLALWRNGHPGESK